MAGEIAEDYEMLPCETKLAKVIAMFPERVREALHSYEPSIITRYILELCKAYNVLYHDCKIITCEDEKAKSARLALTSVASAVLKKAMSLICLATPEKI